MGGGHTERFNCFKTEQKIELKQVQDNVHMYGIG